MRFGHNPVADVQWVPIEKVHANDYNPNAVARVELILLYLSIKKDGYTQPVVTIYDPDRDLYVIVDGFHRYSVMRMYRDIYDANEGHLPIVVIDKPINDRMASTIRHNRARGKHSVQGMATIVFEMLRNGWEPERICTELGLEKEEFIRLTVVSGYAALYRDVPFGPAMQSEKMIENTFASRAEVSDG